MGGAQTTAQPSQAHPISRTRAQSHPTTHAYAHAHKHAQLPFHSRSLTLQKSLPSTKNTQHPLTLSFPFTAPPTRRTRPSAGSRQSR